MNNPFLNTKFAESYDSVINLPFIKLIRQQEAKTINWLFNNSLTREDSVLEIGAGTGFYTLDIARKVNSVIALEPSIEMLKRLEAKLKQKNIENVKIVNEEFLKYNEQKRFDFVVIIGVLDYIEDWENFLNHSLSLAKKGIIFTAPHKGSWSFMYSLASKLTERTIIHRYSPEQLKNFLQKYKVNVFDTGLKFFGIKGMTLIVKVALN